MGGKRANCGQRAANGSYTRGTASANSGADADADADFAAGGSGSSSSSNNQSSLRPAERHQQIKILME